ncbi:MAG: hypothetical protein ACI8QS_000851 [Planctomycetota bacterium]|jgi:hypothetical protein
MQHPTRMVSSVTAALLLAGLASANSGLEPQASQALGLSSAELIQVNLIGAPGVDSSAFFTYGGTTVELQLSPSSPYAEGFQLLEDRGNGDLVAVTPQPSRTYRGTVAGLPGSIVAGSWLDDGLYARVRLNDSADYWIQPLQRHIVGALPGQHVLYSSEDVLDHDKTCGLDLLANARPPQQFGGGNNGGGGTEAAGSIAELALDADFEYFQAYGSSGAVQSMITAVISTMNLQYEAEVDITHLITAIVVRTTSSDPYSSTNANTLLDQFVNEWNSNQGSIQRDVAQLFTGKEIDSGTIGIAYVGVICHGSFGYGLVQSDFNSNFSCSTDLSAHELGHNWSAGHCNCTSNTMNPYITCANTFSSNFSRPDIISHRDSRSCLDGGTPPPDATSVNIASITVGTVKANKGNKNGRATVTVVDDNGDPVAGAVITGDFSGPYFNESGVTSSATNSSGVATLMTSGSAKGKVNFTFCVTGVAASLPYDSGGNGETCDSL